MISTDVQQPVFRGEGVALCRFRCPANHRRWTQENAISDGHNLAFPRFPLEIRPRHGARILVDPGLAVFYNNGDRYHRRLITDAGDAANVFLFGAGEVVSALAEFDPSARQRPHAPFVFRGAPVDAGLYLRQRLLMDYAATERPSPLYVHEEALGILGRAIDLGHAARDGRPPVSTCRRAGDREATEHIRHQLALNFDRPVRLDRLAEGLGWSTFRLCRTFRRECGTTVYRYLQRIRLRAALDTLLDTRRSLVEIALDTGFSHQSHFTEAFRREFGVPPGRLRRRSRISASDGLPANRRTPPTA